MYQKTKDSPAYAFIGPCKSHPQFMIGSERNHEAAELDDEYRSRFFHCHMRKGSKKFVISRVSKRVI
jgi:hypothetical protein